MQTITSEKTSLNIIPRTHRLMVKHPFSVNLDIGGGKYDTATDYLNSFDIENLVYDPFNRSEEHNLMVLSRLAELGKVDTVTISNVLNVIREPEERAKVLSMAARFIKVGGLVHISVYEGDRSGVGKVTTKGWQENRRLKTYEKEVAPVFTFSYTYNRILLVGIPEEYGL